MILIIDNYDSFTYNLARYFEELGESVKVIKNDEIKVDELNSIAFSHLVISPGPCTPTESGICLDAIKIIASKKPIMGVCLGHQAICHVFGAKVQRAKNVLHGKVSELQVTDSNSRLFNGCAKHFNVTRYHSLLVENGTLPVGFNVTAICKTNDTVEIMSVENHELRLYGIQFHPESLLTEFGHKILSNFLSKG